jgi:hypothetical protein
MDRPNMTVPPARDRAPSRWKRAAFSLLAVGLALMVPTVGLLATDVYLHRKYQRSAGFNIWGYRGPVVRSKARDEFRVAFLGGSTAFGYGVNWDESIPALLERRLRERAAGARPFSVVNLAYNNEGAYSFTFTLRDYAYLDYDLVCLYEGYNDVMGDPRRPNLSVFRHESPIFRLTGYLPIFPIIFKEKAAAMLSGGDAGSFYREQSRTVFRPSLATKSTAEVLNAAAEVGESLERQLGKVTTEAPRGIADADTTGCKYPWGQYCRSMFNAVQIVVGSGKQVLVITQPYELGEALRARHIEQQREMAAMLQRRFGGDRRVGYLDLGDVVDLGDPRLSFDRMHLTAAGNRRMAERLVDAVLARAIPPH